MRSWRTIGVIGGMGPAATADFLARLVDGAGATRDADHPRILVDCNPQVPDRNAAFAGTGPSPGPVLAAMAQGLIDRGAQVLAMPCNAAHAWAAEIRAVPGAHLIDIVDVAIAAALRHAPAQIGLIAVGATLDARLYHDRAPVPLIEADRRRVQALVDRVKAGDTGPLARDAMAGIAAELVEAGADVIIAACTEVPLLLSAAPVPLVDATAALAQATLAAARGDLAL
jgi:aspartate racemase